MFFTREEAADLIGIHPTTISTSLNRGAFPLPDKQIRGDTGGALRNFWKEETIRKYINERPKLNEKPRKALQDKKKIKKRFEQGDTYGVIAKDYEVSIPTIKRILGKIKTTATTTANNSEFSPPKRWGVVNKAFNRVLKG